MEPETGDIGEFVNTRGEIVLDVVQVAECGEALVITPVTHDADEYIFVRVHHGG